MTELPVVLLHAFPLSSAMWAAQSELDPITPDLPGFGGAPVSTEAPGLGVLADSVLAALDDRGLSRVVLGGLSMGGYVAMEILRRRPECVAALVLADTKASADAEAARANRERVASLLDARKSADVLVEEVLPGLLGDTTKRDRPAVVAQVRSLVESADPAAAAWAQRAMAARPDSFDTLRAADVPALVAVGAEDALTPVSESEAMVDALPQGRLEVVEGVGHLSAVEAPERFNPLVRQFVSSL
ncbi:MAG: alpha/beta fold hydrolase [Nocardioidaceae bacterium]